MWFKGFYIKVGPYLLILFGIQGGKCFGAKALGWLEKIGRRFSLGQIFHMGWIGHIYWKMKISTIDP
jgi:hypothetical protein